MLRYPWTHVGTPSHLGHMDRVAATMPSQAHAGAAQEAPDIGQWEGRDVPLVRSSSCNVKRRNPEHPKIPTYPPLSSVLPGPRTLSSVPLGQELCLQYPWAKDSVISTPGPRTLSSVPLGEELCHQYPWAKKSVFSTPGPRTLSSVPLGQELCHQYPWAKNSVISTPGPRTLSSVPHGQELSHQYPWAKNSVISTPGPRTLSSVALGQELCLQYPWAKNSVISTPGRRILSSVPLGQESCLQYPGPRTLSSVPLGQELSHQYPWPRTLSSVPLGVELCHRYPWVKYSVIGTPGPRTVARTLCPKDLAPLVVRDPATKELLSDPADVAKVFGDTLLHLGGHPDYAPPPGLRQRGPVPLAHMPRFCQERPHTSCDLAGVPEPLKRQ